MQVVRMENPQDQRGPFWSSIDWPRHVQDEFVCEVKGRGPNGECLDGYPNAKNHNVMDEVEEAYEKGDPRYDQFVRVSDHAISNSSAGANTPNDLIFGMATEADFDKWYNQRARELAAQYGFKKAVYEVPDTEVAVLYTQAVWKRKDGQLVKYEDLI